ncbi:LPS assembly lipoprotein LptE [Dyella sp.]|jgi:LPS-assembly lipoprotein|uniref:LPS-assembly lipoprotein LptE n=1 Tax=Dyella sp. TaxID=1869338 RepID=UPI002C9374AC|nr:LPS assembly lipoprotein LptE [Dyella sp.]HTC27757.1 LPS assembly lipoprotein LptE [Dyella sp.]
MNRLLKPLLLLPVLALVACGFHLRGSTALPKGMERVHLTVGGGGDLQRKIARALLASNVKVEKESGTGIAELHVPIQTFSIQTLTVNGVAQVTEYAVHYHVLFNAQDGTGKTIIPGESIDMQRSYSYDASQVIGTQAQVEAIQGSLVDDMVQAILFRLQAVRKNGEEAAVKAAGTAAPASAASTMNSSPQAIPSTTIP